MDGIDGTTRSLSETVSGSGVRDPGSDGGVRDSGYGCAFAGLQSCYLLSACVEKSAVYDRTVGKPAIFHPTQCAESETSAWLKS